jgi:hypothetical protein
LATIPTASSQQPKYLLTIDPGLATGVVYMDIEDPMDPIIIGAWEMSPEEFYHRVEEIISTHGANVRVVIERYIVTEATGKKSAQPWSLELIGVTRKECWKYGAPLTLQKPSEKEFATNEKLRHVGFWYVGGDGHANDAFRHALVYLNNRYARWGKKLVM